MMARRRSALLASLAIAASTACAKAPSARQPRNLLLITIDTLRADRIGAYGYTRARTPHIDRLAQAGTLFERAYAAAPITLPSHATILSGRYPPGHGARDNGMRVSESTPTLATELKARGFRTGAFVAAFPLDHQFGLDRGFDVYSDRLPRDAAGRQANERPASQVVEEAIAWLAPGTPHPAPGTAHSAPGTQHPAPGTQHPAPSTQHPAPFFAWLHFFEPHAPYGLDATRPVSDRYDDEIATVDAAIGRLVDALGPLLAETLVVVVGDHGEAFGEHGEYAHSIFVYDTTLRVPLILLGPSSSDARRTVPDAVTLADVAPTVARILGFEMTDVDGIDLSPALAGRPLAARELYAESFAPLLEFGWAPLRSVRSGSWKYIAAPKPELYDVGRDPNEERNVYSAQPAVGRGLDGRASRYSPPQLSDARAIDSGSLDRLRALGYAGGSRLENRAERVDPKDRRDVAAAMAQVIAGELTGAALTSALERILQVDPDNGQMRLRLGYARLDSGDCSRAEQEFRRAIESGLPGADAHLGLATCLGRRNDQAGAERALLEAQRREPANPVIVANIGILKATRGDAAGAVEALKAALAADPNLHEARFNLALVYARAGRRTEAAAVARELLGRLPPGAPQRSEVERLLRAVATR